MTLLDRFRAQSDDKHSDPNVRLAFVEELPLSEKEAIAAAAREDDDPRVRKAAVAKLMDPATLALYATICGRALARAHARSGDRIAIAAYLGTGDTFDQSQAKGFIEIWSLPSKISARRDLA